MIADALNLIKEELGNYMDLNKSSSDDGFSSVSVILDNISDLDKQESLSDSVIISLVNIEEESSFKNIKATRTNQFTGKMEYLNPPVFLNLYILISCTLAESGERYRTALHRLGLVIQFFQSRKIFTLKNATQEIIKDRNALEPHELRNLNDLKVIIDLYTLTFEQINHLWGSLGGKQVPFAMYKVRLVEIKDEQVQKGGGIITEIKSNEVIY